MSLVELFSDGMFRSEKQNINCNDLVDIVKQLLKEEEVYMAIVIYRVWIKYNANDKFLHLILFNLGVVFMNSGNLKEAKKYFWKSLKLDPLFVDAYANLVHVFDEIGRSDEDIVCLNNSISALNSLETLDDSQTESMRIIHVLIKALKKKTGPLSLSGHDHRFGQGMFFNHG